MFLHRMMTTNMTVRILGSPSQTQIRAAEKTCFHHGNSYLAIMDHASLWKADVLDVVVEDITGELPAESDLFLLLAECVSNAALHGKAEVLAICLRRRGHVSLLSFYQQPFMGDEAVKSLDRCRSGVLPDELYEQDGGFGFPILTRMARHVTISADRSTLRLWFKT